ncbi:disulfide interchange protein DsbE, partial [Vibrio parahaemolyticus EKP-028]
PRNWADTLAPMYNQLVEEAKQ